MIKRYNVKLPTLKLPQSWRRRLFWTASLSIAILAIAGSRLIVQNNRNQSNYKAGAAAYNASNCNSALDYLRVVAKRNTPFHNNDYFELAQPKIQECQALIGLISLHHGGNHIAALQSASTFVATFKNSHLTPLVYEQSTEIFENRSPEQLAGQVVCPQLTVFTTRQLIPNSEERLPLLYFACGEFYRQQKQYETATPRYQKVLNDYPEHDLAAKAQSALASMTIEQAKAEGVDAIELPQRIGRVAAGTAVIAIQNDAPELLEITFSGASSLLEKMPDCPDCQVFSSPPPHCPEKGPLKEYTLKPGEYDVLFRSPQPSTTKPMAGVWNLEDGAKYYLCSFVVRNPSGSSTLPSADTFKRPSSSYPFSPPPRFELKEDLIPLLEKAQ